MAWTTGGRPQHATRERNATVEITRLQYSSSEQRGLAPCWGAAVDTVGQQEVKPHEMRRDVQYCTPSSSSRDQSPLLSSLASLTLFT